MKKKKTWLGIVIACLVVFVVCVVPPLFLFESISIQGSSMEPTLGDCDVVLLDKFFGRFRKLKRYDVIVFYPNEKMKISGERYYTKRIIGLPGETVQIQYGTVYINGRPLVEPVRYPLMEMAGQASEPIVLGDDEYFVLGDNRNESKDSRFLEVGPVKEEYIEGRLLFRISPVKKLGIIK